MEGDKRKTERHLHRHPERVFCAANGSSLPMPDQKTIALSKARLATVMQQPVGLRPTFLPEGCCYSIISPSNKPGWTMLPLSLVSCEPGRGSRGFPRSPLCLGKETLPRSRPGSAVPVRSGPPSPCRGTRGGVSARENHHGGSVQKEGTVPWAAGLHPHWKLGGSLSLSLSCLSSSRQRQPGHPPPPAVSCTALPPMGGLFYDLGSWGAPVHLL